MSENTGGLFVNIQGGLLVLVQGGLLVLVSDMKFLYYSFIFMSENTGGLFGPCTRWSFSLCTRRSFGN